MPGAVGVQGEAQAAAALLQVRLHQAQQRPLKPRDKATRQVRNNVPFEDHSFRCNSTFYMLLTELTKRPHRRKRDNNSGHLRFDDNLWLCVIRAGNQTM